MQENLGRGQEGAAEPRFCGGYRATWCKASLLNERGILAQNDVRAFRLQKEDVVCYLLQCGVWPRKEMACSCWELWLRGYFT